MADHRHRRDTNARRKPRAIVIAGPLAFVATASAVGLGVLTSESASSELPSASISASVARTPQSAGTAPGSTSDSAADSSLAAERRSRTVSRSAARNEIANLLAESETMQAEESTRKAIKNADLRLWTTTNLNLWSEPGERAKQVGEVEPGEKVLVTGRKLDGRDEIVVDGKSRWVSTGYLSAEEPATLGGSCTNGTSVPSGVSPNIAAVHEAVCANFPEISIYGTFRSDGEHGQGLAVDIMVSGGRGWEVADFVRENYDALGVNYLIYSQKIWSVDRSGEGWRGMDDRGSTTANHYDHVHVTTY